MFRKAVTSTRTRRAMHVTSLVAPFVAVVLLQATIAGFSIEIMSSVRAYVAGEALWSRSQKNAVYNLDLYLHSGDQSFFTQYRDALAVPMGDMFARLALEKQPMDTEAAERGFLEGGNHPDDIPGMIWLYRYFREVSFLKAAIEHWRATDPMLLELTIFGEAIDAEMKHGIVRDVPRIRFLTNRLSQLNSQFTERANRFSMVLGEGSRAITMLLTLSNILTTAALIVLTGWRIHRLVLQREAFETALRGEKERLVWQATHDPLTGLANRRAFEARLEGELRLAGDAPLGLMLIDLDQFKAVNDTCGHLAGDRLLCQISRLLQQGRQSHQLAARLGGDEFGVILPRCSLAEAVEIAERLRKSLELSGFTWDDRTFAVTASIGVACISDDDVMLEEALRRADAACYRAKEKGRNRVQIDPARPDVVFVAPRQREAAGA
ncbi:GGDEF domain-containing protein [Bradyrhizobium sp.]|uniref:GGDEF domain-containing protein n=1 Tax=Bradyrhizobium sp. TaxID=376 RepID=UPI0039E717D7